MDEDTAARIRYWKLVLDEVERNGFAEAVRLLSHPDLIALLRAGVEVEAWRAVMPQYEYRDGAIKRTLASLPPSTEH